ncbi:MAG: amidohydrolase family protein [Actinobacteria bacterium]|nr:amidohydrolase family protein [Actinomycetota bacterium]
MAHELVIRGGTIVDGTGAEKFTGDVGVDGGRITAVGRAAGGGKGSGVTAHGAGRVIDADGLLVTPGWVDIHTHYDGQATWDEVLAPSSWHGVTTVVMGNCGVGFAPAMPDKHDWLIGLMEGVEDIPGTALAEGIQWEWETFPEYLDALSRRRWTMDVGTQIAHGAVRAYVMGEPGAKNEPANDDEIARMRDVVKEAIAAGALGFSTSRTLGHRAIDGEPVPGTFAAEAELFGIGSALGELGRGVFELAPMGSAGEDIVAPEKEVDWMCRLSAAIDRPVTFALLQVDLAPDLWRDLMEQSLKAVANGSRVYPQVAGRATGLLSGFQTTLCLFDVIPEYVRLRRTLSFDELIAALRTPEVRERIVGAELDEQTQLRLKSAYERTFVLGSPPDYEPGPDKTLAAIAAREGRSPLDVAYDYMLADDGRGMLHVPILNYSQGSLEPIREMLLHPQAALGLADGGTHCGVICDASMPTFMLTHWVRDRSRGDRLPLEWVIKKQTYDTARLYGMHDRGTIEPGMLADFNLIDFDGLRIDGPEAVADLPAGGKRLVQRAHGYVATVKRGEVTFADGEDTGVRPGSLVRGPQASPA